MNYNNFHMKWSLFCSLFNKIKHKFSPSLNGQLAEFKSTTLGLYCSEYSKYTWTEPDIHNLPSITHAEIYTSDKKVQSDTYYVRQI